MSADKILRLQVVFAALDRLGAPLRQLQAGSRGLGKELAATQRELAGLKKAQLQVAQFRGAEQRFQASTKELDTLRAKTAAVRAEIEKVDAPTKKMAASLRAAEAAEAKAIGRNESHSNKLQELSRALEGAGVDVARLGEHEEKLGRQMYEANKRLDAQREKLERIQRVRKRGEAMRETGGRIAGAGAVATVGITAPVLATISSSIPAAIESAKALADVNAALASMGPTAGRSIGQLTAQASRLQDLTLFDDDDIMKDVTAQMLTFSKVSGKVFDEAQLQALNVAVRFKKDIGSAAIMVGKALQDPVKGITALSRAGITFDASQKKMIKGWVDQGDIVKAQTYILGELARQSERAAEAQRKADPTAQSQQDWRTFQENVGGAALKLLPALTSALHTVLDAFNSLSPGMQKTLVIAALVAAALGPIITVIGGLVGGIGMLITAVTAVSAALSIGLLPAIGVILLVVAAVAALIAIGVAVYRNWGPITQFFTNLWAGIKARFFEGVAFLRSLIPSWSTIGRLMLDGLLTALNPMRLAEHILKLGSMAVKALKDVLGIKSPSRVFAAIGGHMMAGLDRGLDRGAGGPLRRLGRIGDGMTAAMAGGALMAAPAAASPAAGGGGARPPAVHHNYFTITLQGGAGAEMRAQARELWAEIQRLQAEAARSSYEDRD